MSYYADAIAAQLYGGQPPVYGDPYQPQYQQYVPVRQNQQYIPVTRNINPQSVIRPVGTDMTSGQRNVDLTKGTEYDLNPGEKVEKGRVVDSSARGGIPRWVGGTMDAIGGLLGQTWDFDKRGDINTAAEGGLGRVPTVKQPDISQTSINTPDPSYMPGYDSSTGLPTRETQEAIRNWRSDDAAALYRDRTSQRVGDFRNTVNEFQRINPLIRDQLLTSRMMTEAYSPAELQARMGLASRKALDEAKAMNQYQMAANDWVRATNTMPSRSFGQAVVANVPNISGRA